MTCNVFCVDIYSAVKTFNFEPVGKQRSAQYQHKGEFEVGIFSVFFLTHGMLSNAHLLMHSSWELANFNKFMHI